jgi:hypothetical protein
MHGALESAEEAAELGVGGVPPAFPDTVHADDEDADEDADATLEPAATRG